MGIIANRPAKNAQHYKSGLLIAVMFLAVAVTILGIAAFREHSIAAYEQELEAARPTEVSSLLKELRARERELLDTVAVIDSAAGVYRIPIDRAMELVAAEGGR